MVSCASNTSRTLRNKASGGLSDEPVSLSVRGGSNVLTALLKMGVRAADPLGDRNF